MGARRIAAVALSGALLAGGTGAAIAAVTEDDGKKVEQAVLDDAAERLDVTPEKLRDALLAAQDAQLDQAVKDGDLTQKQADEIKAARKRSGRVLGPLGGPHVLRRFGHGPGGPGFGKGIGPGRGALGADLAKALGTTPQKLREALRSGDSIADIAKANGKTVAQVTTALEAAAKTRLDKAVENGDLTQKQADRMLERIGRHIEAIASGRMLRMPRPGHHGMRGHHVLPAPPDEVRPGGLMPGDEAPALAAPGEETFS